MNQSQRGFTLIELLIVLAVVVILAAFLIPNLLDARNRAYDGATMGYGRQMLAYVTSWLSGDPGNRVTDLPANCVDTAYVTEGALAELPASVQTCEILITGDNTYTVKVTSRSGRAYTLGN